MSQTDGGKTALTKVSADSESGDGPSCTHWPWQEFNGAFEPLFSDLLVQSFSN